MQHQPRDQSGAKTSRSCSNARANRNAQNADQQGYRDIDSEQPRQPSNLEMLGAIVALEQAIHCGADHR